MNDEIKTIGIIRLHRLGDILQTIAVTANLRTEYPDARISLITSNQFSSLLEQFPHIDEIIAVDTDDIKSLSVDELCAIQLDVPPQELPSSVCMLQKFNFDLLVNLHADPHVAWLTAQLKYNKLRGRKLLPNGGMELNGKWLYYFATCVRNRELALTNIVDVWTLMAGAKPLPALRHKVVSDFDAKEELGLKHNRINIAMQPGSADPHRRWPAEHFINFAQQINQHIPARFVVIGSKDENKLCSEIVAGIGDDALNAAGYNLVETSKILGCSKLLLTGDTGPMHLAALLGVRIIALFFGRTIPSETGPYANQAISLLAPVPDTLPDHRSETQNATAPQAIRPEFAVNAALWALRTNIRDIDLNESRLRFMGGVPGSKAFISQFNPHTATFELHALHYETATLEQVKTSLSALLFYRYWHHLPEWDGNLSTQSPSSITIDPIFEATELASASNRMLGTVQNDVYRKALQELQEELKAIEGVFQSLDQTQLLQTEEHFGTFSSIVDLYKILASTALLSKRSAPIESIINNFFTMTRETLNQGLRQLSAKK